MSKGSYKALMDKREALFKENQARIPPNERAATDDQRMCDQAHDGWVCTKPLGHDGDHIAHGVLGMIAARWSNDL